MSPPVRGFALESAARTCATPEGAYANCLALSARYADWLRGRGEPAALLALRGSRAAFPAAAGRWPFCDPGSHAHWVTASAGWAVDWTWRQFDPASAWPSVVPVAALADRWEEVELWACERCPDLLADPRHGELTPAGLHAEHAALARATAGAGPFPDPRHDQTAPLAPLCRCPDGAGQPA